MDDLRKEQLDAYLALTGKVNRYMHSRLWWATDFSSKNRFNCRLPELLQKFLNEIRAAHLPSEGPIPWQIKRSLQKAGIEVKGRFNLIAPFRDLVWECMKRVVAGGFHFCRLVFRSCYARFVLWRKVKTVFLDQRPAYVIKTFIYDHSFTKDGMYRDSFFGQLPDYLRDKGERVVFFANILGDFKSNIQKIADCPNALIIPVDFLSSLSSILESIFAVWFYWPQVKEPVDFVGLDVRDLVNAELASCSSRIQPYQYLHYEQTNNMLKKVTVKAFLMTYENNPWEKMCIIALRECSKQTEIIGYQHTVNPQASVNMYISREESHVIPKPDRVLTVGEAPREIIQRYTQITSLPVQAACALRYEHLWKLSLLPRTKSKAILLALEGIFDVYQMVNFVIGEFKGTDYKIIIRTHPVLPVKAFAHKLTERLENLSFVEVSKGKTLIEDLSRTDMTIYWGSAVSLESLWVGKPVIHFDLKTLFSYDPLFDNHHLKKTITPAGKLVEVIEEINHLSDADFLAERQKAHAYLQKYFYPVTPQNLSNFLPLKSSK